MMSDLIITAVASVANGISDMESNQGIEQDEHSTNNYKQPARGEQNGSAVLTEMDVVRIRHYHSEGLNPQKLARRYNVTDVTIRNILNGKSWKHLKG